MKEIETLCNEKVYKEPFTMPPKGSIIVHLCNSSVLTAKIIFLYSKNYDFFKKLVKICSLVHNIQKSKNQFVSLIPYKKARALQMLFP